MRDSGRNLVNAGTRRRGRTLPFDRKVFEGASEETRDAVGRVESEIQILNLKFRRINRNLFHRVNNSGRRHRTQYTNCTIQKVCWLHDPGGLI
jgi:hypothetical protein